MITKIQRSFQTVLLLAFIILPIYCAIFRVELYPFAPYSMYSYRNIIEYTTYPKIYCENSGSRFLVENKMWVPMDEARVTESFENSYFSRNYMEIHKKLEGLHQQIIRNKYRCDSLIIEFKKYYSAEDLLKDAGVILKAFRTQE